MTLRGLIEAVGLALMKAGAWMHFSKGFHYSKNKAEWRFVTGSDPARILGDVDNPDQARAILRALDERGEGE